MVDGGSTRGSTAAEGLPETPTPSEKSYVVAVCISGIFGWIGIQHFYLGRYFEGLIDVALTVGWIYSFAVGNPVLGFACLAADGIHSVIVTAILLTGTFRDGQGRVVCYPGQVLR